MWLKTVVLIGALLSPGLFPTVAPAATSKNADKPSSAARSVIKSSKSLPEPDKQAKKPALAVKPPEPTAAAKKALRKAKAHKKLVPKAIVQPRVDLSGHGLLEAPHRYDPRPTVHNAAVPHPGTTELIHDHFQELDRNQDGRVDPIERAFSRLDIDRDLERSRP